MAPKAHAILSPSGASRWLACSPSARLEEKYPESTSAYADEGTYAHAVAEAILTADGDLNEKIEDLKQTELGKLYHSNELYGFADEYADYVNSFCTGDHVLLVEQRLDLTKYIPEGFGTGDAIVLRDTKDGAELHLIDLKYGKGVSVSAVQNKQLMSYALGAYEAHGWLFDRIKTVHVHVFQPRIDNISEWSIDLEDLLDWGENVLKPGAQRAWEGQGELSPGEHCRFCKVGAECRALAEKNLEIARHEFFGKDPEGLMTLQEIAEVLEQAEHIQLWIKLLNDFVFNKALAGEKVPGYKLVEGRSVRVMTDPIAVKTKLLEAGFNETDIVKPADLLGISALEKKIGKKPFKEIVEPYLEKPPGAPTLVKEDDPRQEWNSAINDFKDILG